MDDSVLASSPALRPAKLTYDVDCVPCHGPLLEAPPLPPLLSPLVRGWEIAQHPDLQDLTPGIAAVAQRFIGKELEALENERIGDALIKEEAKALVSEVKSTLFERKKKRVQSAAREAAAAVEAKVLAKQARQACIAMKRTLSDPIRLSKRTRDRFGTRACSIATCGNA